MLAAQLPALVERIDAATAALKAAADAAGDANARRRPADGRPPPTRPSPTGRAPAARRRRPAPGRPG